MHIRVDADTDQLPVVLMNTSKIDFSLKLSQLKFNVAYGNFESIAKVSSVLDKFFDISEWFHNAALNFINPQIFINATSNIGAYLNFNVDYLKTYSSTQAGDTVLHGLMDIQPSLFRYNSLIVQKLLEFGIIKNLEHLIVIGAKSIN